MKLAIGTQDQKQINPNNVEKSRYFVIYEILNGKIVHKEIVANTFENASDNTAGLLEDLLNTCEIIMGQKIGQTLFSQATAKNKQLVLTNLRQTDQAVQYFLDARDEYFQKYDPQLKEFVACDLT